MTDTVDTICGWPRVRIPESCGWDLFGLCGALFNSCLRGVDIVIGVDEAGRGPVLGSLVYCAAFWPLSEHDEICKLGFDDSKQLKEGERDDFFNRIRTHPSIGWVIEELTAVHISEVSSPSHYLIELNGRYIFVLGNVETATNIFERFELRCGHPSSGDNQRCKSCAKCHWHFHRHSWWPWDVQVAPYEGVGPRLWTVHHWEESWCNLQSKGIHSRNKIVASKKAQHLRWLAPRVS